MQFLIIYHSFYGFRSFSLPGMVNRFIIHTMSGFSGSGLVFSDDRKTVISYTSQNGEESVTVPDTVQYLPAGLFSGCTQLREVRLPHDISALPDMLFEGCVSLEHVVMPPQCLAFGERMFAGCTSLGQIPFRAGIELLPESVFEGCTSLSALVIPSTVTTICSRAAASCTALETVVLPDSLESLAKDAFDGCTLLRHIRISENNVKFRVDENNGCLYEKQDDGVELIVLSPAEFERSTVFCRNLEEDTSEDRAAYEDQDDDQNDEINIETKKAVPETELMEEKKNDDEIAARASQILSADNGQYADDGADPVAVTEEEAKMLERESSILSQNTLIDGNPVTVSQDEVDKIEAKGEVVDSVTPDYYGTPVKYRMQSEEDQPASENDVRQAEDPLIARIADAAEKSECITLDKNKDKPEWNGGLFVFAENLVFDDDGEGHFSDSLISCCRRIARIHGYTHIYLYYGLPLDNEEFAQMFSEFIADRSTIYACDSSNTTSLSASAHRFVNIAGISLEKDMIELENKLAGSEDANELKMIVQDDYSA